ncbi:hypothetical protein Leryth_014488 [Lithospermum erythrorhizon]|nr:hypothetical protein Leryth_014488 [Lithospermum erythrorhizon]
MIDEKGEESIVYLHGDLDLKVMEARELPNMDIVSERLRSCFTALDVCKMPFSRNKKKHNNHRRKIITSDPYVTVCLAGATVARTLGWSIYHKVRLVREPSKPLPSGGNLTLGDLLRYKSQEGVRKASSTIVPFISNSNSFGPHLSRILGMEGGGVDLAIGCKHCSANLGVKSLEPCTLTTRNVIVDSQAPGNNRKISAFIGGLDLCDGRYDTPEHRLFRDLKTVFEEDFHNPTFGVSAYLVLFSLAGVKCPRQPWHDLHCRIEGPAAYDVLTNFEQRWKKAAKWSELGRRFKSYWHDDALLKIERISWITSPSPTVDNDDPSLWVSEEEDPENWHVQVFRSIDSGSVKGFPKDVHLIDSQLKKETCNFTDTNTLFQNCSTIKTLLNNFFWKCVGADNLIPMELALKIASKIRAKERFSVYIVVPMWPEGIPASAAVQEILYWQSQTMQMMYEIIANELKSMQLHDVHPTEYLNFYCLGN